MKKSTSVLALAATTSFWRVLMILILLAATQLLTACSALADPIGSLALEQILDLPVYRFSPSVALTLVTVVLLLGYGGSRSRVNYTMSRLSLSPRSLFLTHVVYCVGIYLLFWLFQVTVVMATSALFRFMAYPGDISHQLELLTCYRSVYLHPLFPLADWPFWFTTPLIYLGLGVNTAMGMVRSWEGRFSFSPVIFSLFTALYAAKPGDYAWAICLLLVVWCGMFAGYYEFVTTKKREVVS